MAERPRPGDWVRYWHRHLDTADEGFQTLRLCLIARYTPERV